VNSGSSLVAAILALALSAAVPAAERPHIRFAEKITVSPGAARAQFDAYGRRFVLNLQGNDRALARLRLKQGTSFSKTSLWRGTLEGQSGSWVRLTDRAGAKEGVIWDGHDLYVLSRYENVADSLGVPLTAQAGDTVIFRLSDSTNLLPSRYCGTGPSADGLESNNSLVQYRNIVAELRLQAQALAGSSRQIEISMIADSAMATRVADPMAEMLSAYNVVDGIYSEQLGLLILPTDMRSIPANGDPFTATNPPTLLAQLSTYRQNTPAVAALDIAHLFTGHDLDNDAAGIARLNGACSVNDAVSLTEGWRSFVSSALIMAHELGHNLGADHDGTGACAAVPETFIMAPTLNGSQQFSQCSIAAINNFIASAAAFCVTPAFYSQVELPQINTAVTGELDEPLVVPFDLHSTGTRPVNDVTLNLRIPESFALLATTPGVTCTPAMSGESWTNGLNCVVGTIAAGETKHLELTFLPGQAASFTTEARVTASNNQNTRNSTQIVSINVLQNVDVSVEAATSAPSATFGDMVDVTLTLRSLRSHTVRDVHVVVNGGGLRGVSVDAPAGVICQFDVYAPGQTACDVGDIPGGETRTIVVHSRASQVGSSLDGTAYVSAGNDPDFSNNNAYFRMSIAAAHDVGLEDATPTEAVQINMPFEYRANLRSYGSQPVDGVRVDVSLFMQEPAALDSVSSVTVGGNTCARLANWHYDCVVGTMAAGEVLPVSIRGIATGMGEVRFTLNSYAAINDNTSNDQVYRGWVVRYGLDASVTSDIGLNLTIGREGSSSFAVWSNGIQAANDAVLIVEIPSQVRFTRVEAHSPATTSCSIVDPQHLRCTYNIPPRSSYQNVTYTVIGDVAGAYDASATITLAGDENLINNVTRWPININPLRDAGVRTSTVIPPFVFTGRDITIPLTVFSGSHPVSGVHLYIYAQASSAITSVSGGNGTCSRVDAHEYVCALGNLAGGSNVDVTAVVAATSSYGLAVFSARVDAPADNNPDNNIVTATFNSATEGDARVAVSATAVTATAGTAFDLPSITVTRQGDVLNGKFTITLPAGMSISSISGSVFACSGTLVVECILPNSWPENQGIQTDFRLLPTVAGNFTITARVSAVNDFTSTNDEVSVAVAVNAVTPPPPPPPSPPPSVGGGGSSGGGGGGGRIEWPVALLLGLMLICRQGRRAPSRARHVAPAAA